ncbi:hypothetical protein ACFX1T_007568 [Malus domestica]
MAMHMEAEVPGIGAVGCYAEKQSSLCGKRKRQQKPLEEEDRQPRSVTPGALRVLPQDEEKERAFTRNFISFLLSKVSKETDAQYMDSVNSCDPSKVAAQLESVLFETGVSKVSRRNRMKSIHLCFLASRILRTKTCVGKFFWERSPQNSWSTCLEMRFMITCFRPPGDDTQRCITRFH